MGRWDSVHGNGRAVSTAHGLRGWSACVHSDTLWQIEQQCSSMQAGDWSLRFLQAGSSELLLCAGLAGGRGEGKEGREGEGEREGG